MSLLIGSTAIKYHFPDFPRDPKDTDYAVDIKEWSKSSTKSTEYLLNPIIGNLDGIASPDTLLTLKMSHAIGWNINWEKHIFDIQFLLKKGAKLNLELFNELYAYWNTVHEPNKRSDLDMSAEEFFNNTLKTPHDYYHTLLKEIPTYTKVLKDDAEVDVSEDKFNALDFEEKCDLVREEVMVMAYERYKHKNFRVAYSIMLKKFILNHAPIWEALFIIQNFVYLHKPNFNYFKKIENELHRIK